MSGLNGYFVDTDADGDLWVWRENGDYPVAVLAQRTLYDDPPVWNAIVVIVEGAS